MAAADCRKLSLIVAALLISLTSCNSTSNRVIEETFEQLYAIEPSASITIQNGDGAILVYGSNVNEMRVRAIKKAYSHARLTGIGINVSTKPGSVSISTKFPPKSTWGLFDRSGTVDYTIVVPATASIAGVNLNAGEILVDGMRGQTMRVRLGEGRIFARNCFANADLAVKRGNLIVSYDWWEETRFSAEANIAHGNVWAYFPGDAAFHLLGKVAHGQIFNDFESAARPLPAPSAGMQTDNVVHGGGEATIKIQVAEGDIKVVEANP
jgi:hypothetical protein